MGQAGSWLTAALGQAAAQAIIGVLPAVAAGADSGANGSGDNDESLQRLIEASCAANMACGNSGLTLVHALSTAPSVRLPHGLKNGILLPHVARFNEEVSAPANEVAGCGDRPPLPPRSAFGRSSRPA